MSLGNAINQGLDHSILDAEQSGKLEDAEIQRLVELSQATQYQRSERIPLKSAEAFAPRSLVSIAMDAQRRREDEMRQAAAEAEQQAAGDPASEPAGDPAVDPAVDDAVPNADDASVTSGGDAPSSSNQSQTADADNPDATGDAADAKDGESAATEEDAPANEAEETALPASTADFNAGRAEGLEEGHKSGFEEGHAKGLAEGRAAGSAEASAQLERAIQAFETATGSLAALSEIDSGALSDSLRSAVLQMAGARAGQVIAEMPAGFVARIETMINSIRTASGAPVIRLNAADLAAIEPLIETREKLAHCRFVADPNLAHGDLSVTVGNIGIDDFLVEETPPAEVDVSLRQPEVAAMQDDIRTVSAPDSVQKDDMAEVAASPQAPINEGGAVGDVAEAATSADAASDDVMAEVAADAETEAVADIKTEIAAETEAVVDAETEAVVDAPSASDGTDDV